MKNTDVRLLPFYIRACHVTNNVNVMLCNINIIMSTVTVGDVSSLMRNKLYKKIFIVFGLTKIC